MKRFPSGLAATVLSSSSLFLVATMVTGCPEAPGMAGVELRVPGVTHQGLETTTVLEPTADTHVRRNTPYYNYGGEGLLRVGTSDRRKALVAFDATAIEDALDGQQLVSAHLELFLGNPTNGFPASGQALVAQPLSQPFSEYQATYSCAADTNPAIGPTTATPPTSGAWRPRPIPGVMWASRWRSPMAKRAT